MSDEREKVLKQNEEPDVEAHKALKATDEKAAAEDDAEAPDVEAHKLLHKTLK
jgi:hypothetical protein